MDIDFVVQGFDQTVGLSRYSRSLLPELRERCNVTVCRPQIPTLLEQTFGMVGDAETFFSSFPVNYETNNSDVVHLSAQTMGIPLLYRDFKSAVVTVHDIFPYIFRQKGGIDPIEPWYEQGMYRLAMRALKEADHLIAISDATKQTLQEFLDIPSRKITRVYYGVDHDAFQPTEVPQDVYERYGLDPENKHVLYVGSERPRKAVPELVEAFADVVTELSDVTLVKVGGPEIPAGREAVEEVINREGLEEHVVFTGHVEDYLTELYNLADVYASASYYEGFGLPFVEAMACGTPVIGRDQSAMPEVIGDGGMLFTSPEELSEALIQFLTDQNIRKSFSTTARKHATTFDWETNALETAEVYRMISP